MRWITPQEKCLTAAEIAARFYELSGVYLQPVNVGNAAKALGLDYLEVEDPDALNPEWGKKRKLYAEADIHRIFPILQELVDRRARYGR